MYTIGHRDRVVQLQDVPQSGTGAPLPLVVADEGHVYLAYRTAQPNPNWDGTYVNSVSPTSESVVAIITFKDPMVHMFGPPNDESFSGHPLAERGLRRYSVSEVNDSSWVEARICMNRVHPHHSDSMFADCRHFIFAFHDSTFECIADDFTVSILHGSINDSLDHIVRLMSD